ncbi:hypothetical protein AA313_de0200102 [Arthrobotrys entomopaga]|nr:hypothetical protein AA313_de0200102 [Arthrobotrys entomopaga]
MRPFHRVRLWTNANVHPLLLLILTLALPTTSKLSGSLVIPRQSVPNPNLNATVDLSTIPKCAVANCITSDAWIPSRLGCLTGNLTYECFCQTAVAPLTCSPTPPDEDDNCFYELSTWFAGICGTESIRTVNLAAIPACGRNCAAAMMSDQGCPDQSLNCVCQRDAIYNQTGLCLKEGCGGDVFKYIGGSAEHFAYSWYTIMCKTGVQEPFDEEGYKNWVQAGKDAKARNIRLGVGLGFGLPFAILFMIIVLIIIYIAKPFGSFEDRMKGRQALARNVQHRFGLVL